VSDAPALTNATRSAYFAVHSSKYWTSDSYCVTSISRGTPGGYDAYQMPSVFGGIWAASGAAGAGMACLLNGG